MLVPWANCNGLNAGLSFWAPLTSTIIPNFAAGSATPTFTRATIRTCPDFEGKVNALVSGEVGFQGARRVWNRITNSDNLAAASWTTVLSGTGIAPTVTPNFGIAPDGTTTAARVQLNKGGGTTTGDFSGFQTTLSLSAALPVHSCWLKTNDGTTKVVAMRGNGSMVVTVTGTWQRLSTVDVGAASIFQLLLRGTWGTADTADLLVWHPQLEDVTGQQNQNPGEYVSVGVLSAPFQGANVDGVQYFEYLNGNTVNANVVTAAQGAAIGQAKNQSAFFPRDTTSNFSTVSAPANQVTGDIDLRADFVFSSTQGGANLISKDAAQRSYQMAVNSLGAGKLRFFYTADGATPRIADSTVTLGSVGIADGTRIWVRSTYATASGVVTFYYSIDSGATWVQLGATVAIAAGNIFAGNGSVFVGNNAGAQAEAIVYRAQVYNGINGTLAVDFNPQNFTSGGSWVSTLTGETWVLNVGAKINNFPLLGYLAEEARTNLCLQSADLTLTWVPGNSTVGSNVALSPDGLNTADKIQEDGTNTQHFITQSFTKAASALAYTASVYFKQAERGWGELSLDDGTSSNGITIWVNLSTGALGTRSQNFYTSILPGGSATISPAPNGWWRVTLTATSTAGVTLRIVLNPTTGDTINSYVGTVGSGIYAWGAQLEQAAFATSYIPTTTVAVTRNADVLTYPSAGNVNGAAGSMYAEVAIETIFGALFTPLSFSASGAYGAGNGFLLRRNFGVIEAGGNGSACSIAFSADTNVHKWGAVYVSGASQAPFLDGLKGSGGTPAACDFTGVGTTTINIGTFASGGTNPHNGNIRNVRIWNRALADSQLQALTT